MCISRDQSGKAAELLLDAGASVNAHNNSYRTTPLQVAVICHNKATFDVLLGPKISDASHESSWRCNVNLQVNSHYKIVSSSTCFEED